MRDEGKEPRNELVRPKFTDPSLEEANRRSSSFLNSKSMSLDLVARELAGIEDESGLATGFSAASLS